MFWVLTGLLMEALVFFSSLNNFTDMTFSRDDAVYEVYEVLLDNGELADNKYKTNFEVYFRGNNYDYIIVTLSDDLPDNTILDYESTDDEGNVIETATGINVAPGENIIKLKNNHFDHFSITLTGVYEDTIESVLFRQTEKDTYNPKGIIYMGIAAVIYIGLTATIIAIKSFYNNHLHH